MADFVKDKSIKYLNKDFDSFKRDLMKYSEAHHSGVFQNFNEASPGMALLEYCAYVGDVLSFYLDQSFREIKLTTAKQEKNVVALAKSLGYKPKGKRAGRGEVYFMLEIPSTTDSLGNYIPNNVYAPVLRAGARVDGPAGSSFETLDQINFSSSVGREVTGSRFDNSGYPTHFAVRKSIEVIGGRTQEDTFTISNFEQFKTIELTKEDVLEVISVTDSDGNEWFEVDYLAQDTVFSNDVNFDSDNETVPYILKVVSVPRRFQKERDPSTNKTSLVFGSGDGINFDDELIPNVADLALPLQGRNVFTSVAIDPQNFLKTTSLGLSPFNTTLTVKYRYGGGIETNVPPGTIRTVSNSEFDFSSNNLDAATKSDVISSIECINLESTDGGGPIETISEIKANSAAFFAAQQRIVTKEDCVSRVLSLPEKFGKPDKVHVKKNNGNSNAIDIHLLSRDSNNNLTVASNNLKKNIKSYLEPFRMLTDGINILDASIINLKCNFGVVVSSKFNRSEILTKCLSVVSDYFDINLMQIGEPIILTDLISEIQNVVGVVSVYELKFTNVIGTNDGLSYSGFRFDVNAHINNNILYCPENSIFEIKFPRKDIIGVAK